jgi:hypothetical protein
VTLKPWTLPVVVLVAANLYPLVTVLRDRIPGPVMQGTFTERELQRDWVRDENSGIALNWYWADQSGFDSVSAEGLAEIGFDCAGNEERCAADERTAWALVMIDDARMEARIEEARRRHDSLVAAGHADSVGWDRRAELARSASRLVIAKIGADPAKLRSEGGAGGVVLPVRVTAWRVSARSDSLPQWFRVNANPMPGTLHLPSEMAAAFDSIAPDRRYGATPEDPYPLPRYEVVVVIGGAGLPRIAEIRPLQ